MAGIKLLAQDNFKLSGELRHDEEDQKTSVHGKRGGWSTFPYITAALMGLTIAGGGLTSNLIVYLIRRFHINSIDAAQIQNVIQGSSNFIPIVGAIVADIWLGCFYVICIAFIISILGMILLTLTVTIPSLAPPYCEKNSQKCEPPTNMHLAILYMSIILVMVGLRGTRFTIATMGADQFDKAKDQGSFFNGYFFTFYCAMVISFTGIVYIQDNISWGVGFGICLGAGAVGFAIFLSGKNTYCLVKPKGSPFTSIARVVIAAVWKRRLHVSSEVNEYYIGNKMETNSNCSCLTSSLSFLNRAAIKIEGDMSEEGSLLKPWSLCTIQQVQDLKTLIQIFPLWSTGIFLNTTTAVQMGLVVLQALAMDRHIGPHFEVPAGTFLVFTLLSTAIFLLITDRFIYPVWQKGTRRPLTPLQRVGFGHILNIIGMAGFALVEARRLHVVNISAVPMSAMWLVVPLAIVGIGEAFHFPGQVALYYQEFPTPLRNSGTAMISLVIAVAFFMCTVVIDLMRKFTAWLPDNINDGRLDNVYWVLVVISVVNFGYYVACATMYRYRNTRKSADVSDLS